jgi:hypothetical protein
MDVIIAAPDPLDLPAGGTAAFGPLSTATPPRGACSGDDTGAENHVILSERSESKDLPKI